MKKTFFSIAMSAILILSFVFVACNRNEVDILPIKNSKENKEKNSLRTKELTPENLANDSSFIAYANLIKNNLQIFANGHYQLSEVQRNVNIQRLGYLTTFATLSGSEAEEYFSLLHISPIEYQNFDSNKKDLVEKLKTTFPALQTVPESTVLEVFKDGVILAGIESPMISSKSQRCRDSAYYKAMKGNFFCFATSLAVTAVTGWWGLAYAAACHYNNVSEFHHDLAGC
jgi:hypothetical protein